MSKPKKFSFSNNPLISGPSLGERIVSPIPYRELELDKLDGDPNQPRVHFDESKLGELSESIKTYGVLSPILVRPGKTLGRYIVVAGERRFRASKLAGLKTIPAIVDTSEDKTGDRTLAVQLVENLQRAELTSLERAHAIGALRDAHNLSVRGIAEKLGVSKSMIQRSLDVLDLPDDLLNALRAGESESKILALAGISDPEERRNLLLNIGNITRDEVTAKIRVKTIKRPGFRMPEDDRIADEIQKVIGLKVSLKRKIGDVEKGKLTIDFYSESDLQEVFRKLVSEN